MSSRKSLSADAGANGKAKPPKVEALKDKEKDKEQNGNAGAKASPKKRRKVNHGMFRSIIGQVRCRLVLIDYTACVYCRRSVSLDPLATVKQIGIWRCAIPLWLVNVV
jgi:hypothetical protein